MRAVTCAIKHSLPSHMNAITPKSTHYHHSLTLLPNKAPNTITHERCYKSKKKTLPSLIKAVTKNKALTTIAHERFYQNKSIHYHHLLTLLPNKAPTNITHERCYKKTLTTIAHERYYQKKALTTIAHERCYQNKRTYYHHSLTLLPNKAPTYITHERCYKKHLLPSLMNAVTKNKALTTIAHERCYKNKSTHYHYS